MEKKIIGLCRILDFYLPIRFKVTYDIIGVKGCIILNFNHNDENLTLYTFFTCGELLRKNNEMIIFSILSRLYNMKYLTKSEVDKVMKIFD